MSVVCERVLCVCMCVCACVVSVCDCLFVCEGK